MNSGMADAHNLAWKLAWVLRGWGTPHLLDTYQAERRPVIAQNIALSLRNYRRVLEVTSALGLDANYVKLLQTGLSVLPRDLRNAVGPFAVRAVSCGASGQSRSRSRYLGKRRHF